MALGQNKEESEETINDPGDKRYGRIMRMLREGFLSVCIYKNVHQNKTFYDIVVYRKVKSGNDDYQWKRGTNLKPSDLPHLIVLLTAAEEYLKALENT